MPEEHAVRMRRNPDETYATNGTYVTGDGLQLIETKC